MAMISRDVVSRTVRFQGADRLAYALTEEAFPATLDSVRLNLDVGPVT